MNVVDIENASEKVFFHGLVKYMGLLFCLVSFALITITALPNVTCSISVRYDANWFNFFVCVTSPAAMLASAAFSII